MEEVLFAFILIPILGFLLSLFISEKSEKAISFVSFSTVGITLNGLVFFIASWLWFQCPTLYREYFVIYKTTDYKFSLDLYLDKIGVVFLFVGALMTFLVTVYSRYYLHREIGYKRFFNNLLFFYIGYNLIVLAGNFETLFVGWEVLGISSFLLISFYKHRYLPVKNAVKVYSVYRTADVGLILVMWLSYHLWHANVNFVELGESSLSVEQSHGILSVFISVVLLFSASAKSAQFPFSSWLPRAMEGPTPSSAIFYGALSVHLGVFLLLRTLPLWSGLVTARLLIILVGVVTAIISTGIGRVQSSVKSQIAYASASQIGLMFIEVALGYENIALVHFMGNAFLRTYQLLISPSVVTYLIHEQFYNFSPKSRSMETFLPKQWQYSLYVLSIKEWNLDSFMYQYLWNPIKHVGKKLNFLTLQEAILYITTVYCIAVALWYFRSDLPTLISSQFPIVFAFTGLIINVKSFTERRFARKSWFLLNINHLWMILAIAANEPISQGEIVIYMGGILFAGLIGYWCLLKLRKIEGQLDLQQFLGHSFRHPKLAFIFFLCCLTVAGFPISPTFIGEDLLFNHIHEHQLLLATIVALNFVVAGLAIVRIYARIFLGPHVNSFLEMTHRSS